MMSINNAWVVRPYPHGNYRMKEFITKEIIATGYPGIGDLSNVKNRKEIKEALKKEYTYSSPQSLGQAAGNIHRLLLEMEKEDYVVVPDGQQIYIGKIMSGYIFDDKVGLNSGNYPHQRKVEWIGNGKTIDRSILPGQLYDTLKGRQTIFSIDYNGIKELVENKKYLFQKNNNFKLKEKYLKRLQSGKIVGINSNSFEDAMCSLFSNYFPGLRRLSTTNSESGDTDLMAELPGNITIRIQVKHFYTKKGNINESVVDQLAQSMGPGDNGIIVTSTNINETAHQKANYYIEHESKNIDFINGEEVVELIFEEIYNLSEEELSIFGLSKEITFL